MIIHNFDIMRIFIAPGETDSPLVVDANTVLADPVPPEYLQPVPANCREIGQAGCRLQPAQTLACLILNGPEAPTAKSFCQRSGFCAPERANPTRPRYYAARTEVKFPDWNPE